jgi:hypothetical protein
MLRGASHWLALSHRRLLIGQRAPISRVGRLLVQSQRSSARLLSNRSFRESIEKIKASTRERNEWLSFVSFVMLLLLCCCVVD